MTDNPYQDPFGEPERYARYEYHLAVDCTLPLMKQWGLDVSGMRVLDLGCGSGGLSVALAESGAESLGIDYNKNQIVEARKLAIQHQVEARFLVADITGIDHLGKCFDLVLLSEVVEHLVALSNIDTVLSWSRDHLAPAGKIYVSFPPWLSPFGGHQAGWPGIRYVPWYHLMPEKLERMLVPGHASRYIAFSQELNRLTIRAFEQITKRAGLTIALRELFHIRPEYYWRYKVPVVRASFLASIPILREITTTGAFYLLAKV